MNEKSFSKQQAKPEREKEKSFSKVQLPSSETDANSHLFAKPSSK